MDEVYKNLLKKLATSWESHPDKPEETIETTLRSLYFAATGNPPVGWQVSFGSPADPQ